MVRMCLYIGWAAPQIDGGPLQVRLDILHTSPRDRDALKLAHAGHSDKFKLSGIVYFIQPKQRSTF